MKQKHLKRTLLALGAVTSAACVPSGLAQSADALLNKLVDKGVLTTKEAQDLRTETDKSFSKAYTAKSGMPDWVTSLKINGDFRGRVEGFHFDNDAFNERLRYRYRLRLGVTAVMKDNLEVGVRLASGDVDGGIGTGLDPISQNQTLQNNGSKKGVFLDLAYGKWTALNQKGLTDAITIGKMENPFVFSDMVFDHDYTPEGIANQFSYAINDAHTLKFNAAAFVLDELGGSSNDPYLYGGQLRWDGKWTDKVASSVGIAALNINNSENLTTNGVPNVNVGNTRAGSGGILQNHYNPVIADAALTYTFAEVPFYKGAFPVKFYGEYLNNAAAENENTGWMAGIGFGKTGKRGTWALDYRYKYLEADAWFEEFTDSDYGTLRPTFVSGSGKSNGYQSGTGVQGHVVRLSYAPLDALTLQSTVWLTEEINASGPGNSDTLRFQLDAVWKF